MPEATPLSITVVGLGPGDASLLTVQVQEVLAAADEVWLRTTRHPCVADLPHGPRYQSFDDAYEREPSFEAVYEAIIARLLALGARPGGVVYAVPGHPLFGEATVRGLLEGAPAGSVRVLPGVSFVDAVLPALGLDPLAEGLLLVDALQLGFPRRLLTPERPTLIAQIFDQRSASHAKLALLEAYPPDHPVRILTAGRESILRDATVSTLDHADVFDHLCTVYLPPVATALNVRSFEGLRGVVARLRHPDSGCPWDLEQTHESLKRFLIEEAYEALEAIEDGEPHRMAEELGDLMMQVLLHAQIAEDDGAFVVEDVIASIASKLVRRHPHVFGNVAVRDADDVVRNWEALKRDERGDAGVLDAVPISLPALAQAQSVQGRAEQAGFRDDAGGDAAAFAGDVDALGDALFALVSAARVNDVDAEGALRVAIRRFRERVSAWEATRRDVKPS